MKDIRLLSLSNSLAWLEFLSRTLTNAFSGAPLPSPPHGKSMNIRNTLSVQESAREIASVALSAE